MLSGVDHITIAVREPALAIACYEQLLGSPPVWRGEHPEHGTRAALFGLFNTLIEIVGPADDGPASEGLRNLLDARGEGLSALALSTDDASACSSALRERGLRATAPQPGEAHAADGSVRHYRTVELSPRTTRGLSVFAVERPAHDQASLRQTPNAQDAAYALDHVVIRTSDPDAANALYGQAFGLRLALDRSLGGHRMLFFRSGGVTLEVVQDAALDASDQFYGLAYRVRDIDAAHTRLTHAGFSLSAVRTGNKPGTQVFTVRDRTCGVPTLVLHDPARENAR